MNYYFEVKHIYWLMAIAGAITTGYFWVNSYSPIHVEGVEVSFSGSDLKINTQSLLEKDSKKYDYYQIYVYPESYVLNCSNNEGVCNKILQNEKRLQKYSLHFAGKSLVFKGKSDIKFDMNFSSEEKKKSLLGEIMRDLFTQEEVFQKNPKTLMQSECEQGVRSSIPDGTGNYEELLTERLLSECQGTENINEITLAFGGLETKKKDSIDVKISIEKLKIVYKFFQKINGEYEEQLSEDEIIDYKLELEGKILLLDL